MVHLWSDVELSGGLAGSVRSDPPAGEEISFSGYPDRGFFYMLNQTVKSDLESSKRLADRRQGGDRRGDGEWRQCEFGSKMF